MAIMTRKMRQSIMTSTPLSNNANTDSGIGLDANITEICNDGMDEDGYPLEMVDYGDQEQLQYSESIERVEDSDEDRVDDSSDDELLEMEDNGDQEFLEMEDLETDLLGDCAKKEERPKKR
jgi:hypothetical protein